MSETPTNGKTEYPFGGAAKSQTASPWRLTVVIGLLVESPAQADLLFESIKKKMSDIDGLIISGTLAKPYGKCCNEKTLKGNANEKPI